MKRALLIVLLTIPVAYLTACGGGGGAIAPEEKAVPQSEVAGVAAKMPATEVTATEP